MDFGEDTGEDGSCYSREVERRECQCTRFYAEETVTSRALAAVESLVCIYRRAKYRYNSNEIARGAK